MLAAAPLAAQDRSGGQPPMPGYTMPATQMWDMTSDSGEIYRIFVSYPTVGEAPAEGYPVLYVLDGNAMFAGFAETRRIQEYEDVGKSIVVGVGYPTDLAYDTRRLNDFTAKMHETRAREPEAAGAIQDRRTRRLPPFPDRRAAAEIGRRHKINPERQALFGHSLGGLFALHALYTSPPPSTPSSPPVRRYGGTIRRCFAGTRLRRAPADGGNSQGQPAAGGGGRP